MHMETYLVLYFSGHLYLFTEKNKKTHKFLFLER